MLTTLSRTTLWLSAYARHLGIAVSHTDPAGPVWDGQTLHARAFDAPSDFAHEIAHWVLADPTHRAAANFGLGADWRGGPAPLLVDVDQQRAIEGDAAALGIAMVKLTAAGDWGLEVSPTGWAMSERSSWAGRWAEHSAAVEDHVEAYRRWLTWA